MKLAQTVDLSFSSVTFGKYSVQLVVRDFLHCFLQADEHGAVLDFVAFYQRGHPAARPWLEQIVRLVCMAVRSELKRCKCAMVEDQGAANTSSACCSYHHEVMDDLPECNITPLCASCLLIEEPPVREVVCFDEPRLRKGAATHLAGSSLSLAAAAATPLPSTPHAVKDAAVRRHAKLPYCENAGHSTPSSVVCLRMKLESGGTKSDVVAEQLEQLLAEVASVKAKLDDIKLSTDDIKSSTDDIKSSTDDIKASTDVIKVSE